MAVSSLHRWLLGVAWLCGGELGWTLSQNPPSLRADSAECDKAFVLQCVRHR
jgi:hypothetical protein